MKNYNILSKVILIFCMCGIITTIINMFTGIINPSITAGGSVISIRFNLLSDFIEGVMVGLGLLFVLIGMCYEKYDISKIKKYLFSIIVTK